MSTIKEDSPSAQAPMSTDEEERLLAYLSQEECARMEEELRALEAGVE